jgi:hypothetical protein
MHKLAPLVEKGGVVLVPLDDEPIAVGETRALTKVVRNAANQITRIVPLSRTPRERTSSGFPVSARDDQRAFAANEEFLQQFWQRAITKLSFEHLSASAFPREIVLPDHRGRGCPKIPF